MKIIARLPAHWNADSTQGENINMKNWLLCTTTSIPATSGDELGDEVMCAILQCSTFLSFQLKNLRIWLFVFYFLALFIASFESEGPENHMEKDSWKTLRYEVPQNLRLCRHTQEPAYQLPPSYLQTQLKTKYTCVFFRIQTWQASVRPGFSHSISSQISSGCKVSAGIGKENILGTGYQMQSKDPHF